jgi:hypothetical protein
MFFTIKTWVTAVDYDLIYYYYTCYCRNVIVEQDVTILLGKHHKKMLLASENR